MNKARVTNLFLVLLTALFGVQPLAAQTNATAEVERPKVASSRNPADAASRPNSGISEPSVVRTTLRSDVQRPFSLREAVEMALQNNPELELARQKVRTGELEIESARGGFDPVVSFAQDYQRVRSPATNFFGGSLPNATLRDTALTNLLRIEKPLAQFGTIIRGELATQRRTTNNPFETFIVNNQSDLRFSVTQPLFRGRSIDEARRGLGVARKNLQFLDKEFRARAVAVLTEVKQNYWELAFLLKNLKSQEANLRDTEKQLEAVRRRVTEGELAPVETLALERQKATLESAVFALLDDVAKRENSLKALILKDDKSPLWSEVLLPVEEFEAQIPAVSLDEALSLGYASRAELSQNEAASEVNNVNRTFLRDRLKPQVDLTASYNLSGFAGTANPNPFDPIGTGIPIVPPPTLTGNYLDSLVNLPRNRFNTFQVGITITFPVGNRSARAELGKAEIEAERLATERRQINQRLQSEIRSAWTALENAKKKIVASRAAFVAATREYESEKRKFDEGYKNVRTFDVLQRQITKIEFENDYNRALIDLRKAVSEFERATGIISGVELK